MFQTDRKHLELAMCSVVGCDSWRRSAPRFKLPEDPERRLEWVQFILEVNGQKLKESSWTDITICKEHFTSDCFVNLTPAVTVKLTLKPEAVPSLRFKSEPEEHELKQVRPQYVLVLFLQLKCKCLSTQTSTACQSNATDCC